MFYVKYEEKLCCCCSHISAPLCNTECCCFCRCWAVKGVTAGRQQQRQLQLGQTSLISLPWAQQRSARWRLVQKELRSQEETLLLLQQRQRPPRARERAVQRERRATGQQVLFCLLWRCFTVAAFTYTVPGTNAALLHFFEWGDLHEAHDMQGKNRISWPQTNLFPHFR